jgi:hypothetical protein
MGIPLQLKRAKQANKRSKRTTSRPTIELMPVINLNDLRHAIPRDYSTNVYINPFRYPQVKHIRISYHNFEITDHSERVQSFRIIWIRTYYGRHRAVFVCSCGRRTNRLFAHYGTYACRFCHKALYTSQRNNQIARKRFAAAK